LLLYFAKFLEKALKILYLHQYFNTPEMSGGTRSYEMAKRLVKAGHQVEMVTSWRENDGKLGWFTTNEEGINVHWLSVPYSNKMGFIERIKAFLLFAFGAAKKAIELKGDVILATSTPLTIAIPGIIVSKIKRLPMVFEVRDLWPELPIAIGAIKNPILKLGTKLLEKIAYFSSEKIIALSPGMYDGIIKTGYPKKRLTIIPNSCDFDLFETDLKNGINFRNSNSWLKNKPLVIYCGTLGQINGVEYLAKVAHETLSLDKQITFLVVGAGKMEEYVRATAEKLGVLGQNFYMLKEMKKHEVAAVFSAATISCSLFINLKEMEANSANKFFDSLAAGKPIMINYGGWQAELLEKTEAGFVVDVNSPKQAALDLKNRIDNEKWLSQASKASKNLGKSRFSRDNLAKSFEKTLLAAIKTE
jgi:glycosyltransferase involved in cell wall biosynthesis